MSILSAGPRGNPITTRHADVQVPRIEGGTLELHELSPALPRAAERVETHLRVPPSAPTLVSQGIVQPPSVPTNPSVPPRIGHAGRGRRRVPHPRLSPGATWRFLEGDDRGASLRDTPRPQRRRDWKLWPIYVKEATERDKELTEDWDGDMDTLLIFAGLFSAVVTSFLSQNAIGNLSPPTDQYALAIALQQLNGTTVRITAGCDNPDVEAPFNPACFAISPLDQLVNGFWFAALTFSLAAALLAMLSKTWIREYSSGLASIPFDQARQQQYRYTGQKRWKLGEVLNSLLLLLHMSVFLFFAGLIVFLEELDTVIFHVITTLFAVTLALYALVSALPLFFPDCPYRVPLVKFLRVWVLQRVSRHRRRQTTFREQEIYTIEEETDVVEAGALAWLMKVSDASSEKEDVQDAALTALADMSSTDRQRRAMQKEGITPTLHLYRVFLECDDNEEDRKIRVLHAIEAMWKSQLPSTSAANANSRWIPSDDLHDDLHILFFNRLVDILETSDNRKLLAAAIRLPQYFATIAAAEWPFASRVYIPAMAAQISNDRFNTNAGLASALDLLTRIFRLCRTDTGPTKHRTVMQGDLQHSFPCVSDILLRSTSKQVTAAAMGVVDELDQFIQGSLASYVSPDEWLEQNISLVLGPHGLMPAMLSQLADESRCSAEHKRLARQVVDYLLTSRHIGDHCIQWIIEQHNLLCITQDIKSFDGTSDLDIVTPLHLFDVLSRQGRFLQYLDEFIDANSVEALTAFLSRSANSIASLPIYSGILRRLIRLSTTRHSALLKQTGVLELMLKHAAPFVSEGARPEAAQELQGLLDSARVYVTVGALSPGRVPEVVLHPLDVEEEGLEVDQRPDQDPQRDGRLDDVSDDEAVGDGGNGGRLHGDLGASGEDAHEHDAHDHALRVYTDNLGDGGSSQEEETPLLARHGGQGADEL